MTKQEFAAQYQIIQSRLTRRLGIAVVIGWGFIFGTLLFGRSVTTHIEAQDWAGFLQPYGVIGTAGFIVIAICIATLFLKKPEGVRCPNCGKGLTGTSAGLV